MNTSGCSREVGVAVCHSRQLPCFRGETFQFSWFLHSDNFEWLRFWHVNLCREQSFEINFLILDSHHVHTKEDRVGRRFFLSPVLRLQYHPGNEHWPHCPTSRRPHGSSCSLCMSRMRHRNAINSSALRSSSAASLADGTTDVQLEHLSVVMTQIPTHAAVL